VLPVAACKQAASVAAEGGPVVASHDEASRRPICGIVVNRKTAIAAVSGSASSICSMCRRFALPVGEGEQISGELVGWFEEMKLQGHEA
jgi:hypothetical protein